MVDESSLASTRQMQAFMEKIGPQDRVLLIGDTRQHQSVDAGKPFEQMQQAGMQTSQLDQIMRQKDPELLRAVEHLSKNETAIGLTLLQQQGRVTEIPENVQRIEAIAKDYVARPENTLVVSPDNASRQEINNAIRSELQASGVVSQENHSMNVLTPRSDMTTVDRSWAARYQPDDVLHYTRGSKEHGIEKGSYATVVSANHKENQITVQKPEGQQVTYDPKRLQGIAAYREIDREFAQGDRIQFTANNRELAVSNRDMGTIERIDANQVSVKMDGAKERTIAFDPAQMRHFDHGYAVTSHSSQGLTADRVLVNMDTKVHPELINTRFAYVSVSRASEDVRIYTNDAAVLSERLSTDVTKTSAVEIQMAQVEPIHSQQTQAKEPPMTNSREHSQEELRRQTLTATTIQTPESLSTTADIEHRHNAPIRTALPNEAADYQWKRETGEVQSYQHTHAGTWLHIDPHGQFYDRQAQPITRETALEQAGQAPAHAMGDNTPLLSRNGSNDNDQGFSL
jgi:ATP-dependent exoDNAse (exonuclease V) alpha subunit